MYLAMAIQWIIVADNRSNQLLFPIGLASDKHGYLYVAGGGNHRVQRFSINC